PLVPAVEALAPMSFGAVLRLRPCAVPRRADVPPPPRLNGKICLQFFVGDVPPRLADVSSRQLRPNGACFRLLVDGAHPLLAVGLQLAGVLAATTSVSAMLCKCLHRTFEPVGQQPRLKMHRGGANSASPRIDG